MNVFIAVDMEGATGVVHPDQLVPDGRNYTQAQSLLTRDVNAVISGILTVEPAAYICVGDGHATMRNILLEDLHPNAELVCGPATIQNKPLCQLEGISSKFDIAMCIGYHTKAGTPGGLLAHTFVGSLISDLRMNGVSVGEVEVNSAVMSSYGVPLCLIYGNSDLEPEIRAWNDASVFLASKTVLGPTAAICKPPAITQRLLEHGAARATADSQTWFRYACGSVRFEVDTKQPEQLERACITNAVIRVSDKTFAVESDNAADAFRLLWAACVNSFETLPSWLQ